MNELSCFVNYFSGYGSQAVSSTNLSSEDSMSIRSISVDETPDIESRAVLLAEQLQPVSEVSGRLRDKEADASNTANWKYSANTAPKNETHTNCDAQNMAPQKPVEMLDKGGDVAVTGGPLLMQNTASAEEKHVSTVTVLDRNYLSLELTRSHTSNLGNADDSRQNGCVGDMETSSVQHAVSETQQTVEGATQHVSGDEDYSVSTTESPASDSQSEASRTTTCDSMFISPSEDTQILAETESVSSKTVSSPEPASTSVTNSGDDESPCEGTSVVHTHLPPGKVCYVCLYLKTARLFYCTRKIVFGLSLCYVSS